MAADSLERRVGELQFVPVDFVTSQNHKLVVQQSRLIFDSRSAREEEDLWIKRSSASQSRSLGQKNCLELRDLVRLGGPVSNNTLS